MDWQANWSGEMPATISGGPVRRAVLNLLLNASAATPEGGEIGLRVDLTEDHLAITVSDQGAGMPEDSVTVLVDANPGPSVRAGRGLGLWMVRRMVDACGGKAIVGARRGGSLVTLILPVQKEAQHERSHAA